MPTEDDVIYRNISNLIKESKKRKEEALHKRLGLSYRYYRGPSFCRLENKIVSVGWKIETEGDVATRRVFYSVAFCGKKDSFSRREARKYINERFANGHQNSFVITEDFPDRAIPELIKLHYNCGKGSMANLGATMIPKWAVRIW